MGQSDFLGKPGADSVLYGKHDLIRYHLISTTAAPVSVVNIYGLQEVTLNAMTSDEENVLQIGGSDEARSKRSNYSKSGSIEMLSGDVMSFMAALYGMTWDTSNEAGVNHSPPPHPLAFVEMVMRDEELTHLESTIIQMVQLNPFGQVDPLGLKKMTLPWQSKYNSFTICAGAKLVVDVFNGDGSTDTFTPSSEPIKILDATLTGNELWDYDYGCMVGVKLSGADEYTPQRSGVAITPATPEIAFEIAPANASQILFAYIAVVA